MQIKDLTLKNIGPFREAQLEFISSEEELENPPVICITGENGTGKSIILDAIRAILLGASGSIERNIIASQSFYIGINLFINNNELSIESTEKYSLANSLITDNNNFNSIFISRAETEYQKKVILDYWNSKLSTDNFNIESITALEPNRYLEGGLTGVHKNIDVTKAISFFDYLRDSKNKSESELGTALYSILEEIINLSIANGKLSHVSRMNLQPIIEVEGNQISLDKLSSGNLYLIQRFISLLSQVYSICVLNNIPITEYKSIKGLLLIDEAENHLHPKWQKVFLKNILTLFPKLQIIVSTHSPFIVSSIQNSRVYVCKSQIGFSIVEEETDFYSNKPVEEILMSPLFNTSNFNEEITHLIESRKEAIKNKDENEVNRIEETLKQINPEYFDYLNLEDLIKSIKK